MNKSFKKIWIISIYMNIVSIVFFFMLVNRFFIDGMIMDLVSTAILLFFGGPSALLIIVSTTIFTAGWKPRSKAGYVAASFIIAALLGLAGYLFSYVKYLW
ncbi:MULTISPECIES: hypothetical protein [unclassified Paenibacillus]|uniref:hypothetical protein n=1 Tax=unclassified Paenibacillus TaxID=185978 RepID=UPI0024054120|nr:MULTISPECIES: hypothetical protein [unclassified Paenibacillus]MDF9844034.1 Zn-dependent protease with chaperone function [Paenibacillus sp. PastF-2]MDF9850639.1 Zn-dependent protease with chaperone function [Paenibacillus sp. PastM-2]MDF9857211.1 Zn-dependent protease with chaperone function [Paenibacillus sp. PastF-1]MDH6482489.1 Zn-dependent protease with chaperone function [Paenibacillus sp. PastH-2]MDH6509908.1 Zn-dependent protease with chaperone function [Paenibacillus sp. PastM-3]